MTATWRLAELFVRYGSKLASDTTKCTINRRPPCWRIQVELAITHCFVSDDT